MKNGKCPKCASTDIRFTGRERRFRSYREVIMVGWFGGIMLDEYICADCGYVETYVEKRALQKLQKLPAIKK